MQKRILLIIGICMGVLILSGGVYLFLGNSNQSDSAQTEETTLEKNSEEKAQQIVEEDTEEQKIEQSFSEELRSSLKRTPSKYEIIVIDFLMLSKL